MEPSSTAPAETALAGGNMGGAVRIGDTVRKLRGPQSDTIQRLTAHVRAQGVTWVPEPLGVDEQGRDVWRFIPGEVSHEDPHDGYPDAVIFDIARHLREWHDATTTFPRSDSDIWWWPGKVPDEVICHVDFAPYNHVFRDDQFVGAIDFDICYPGPRLWDLAYTAYRYVPLSPLPSEPDAAAALRERRLSRLDAFLAHYAGEDTELLYPASALLGYVVERLVAMVEWCVQQDDADRQRDAVMYREHAEFVAAGGYGEATPVTVPNLN